MYQSNFIVAIVMASSFMLMSQHKAHNEYIPDNLPTMERYLSQISSKQQNRVEGKHASKIKKIYADHEERMIAAITDSVYFFNTTLDKNLNTILNEIYSANPEVDHGDYYFFIKNSIIPNAACYGNGAFEINLGLFTTYDTDDELAYVICHEIAHKLQDHSLQKLYQVMTQLNSKQTKEEVKQIKKIKYGRTRAGLTLLDEINSDFLEHSKEAEAQADSLGFVLFQNTPYQEKAALSALKKLKVSDGTYFDFPVKLDSVFNFKGYPFKSYWLEEEISIFELDEEVDDFALSSSKKKTHPDIDYRIAKIQDDFRINEKGVTEDLYLNGINTIAAVQKITYTIDLNLLDLALYQLIEQYGRKAIDESYYHSTMAQVLQRVYVAKKNHELGKYVPRKNNFSREKELNKIRLFLHNLELGEIRRISLAFCETNLLKQPNNEPLKSTYEFFKP